MRMTETLAIEHETNPGLVSEDRGLWSQVGVDLVAIRRLLDWRRSQVIGRRFRSWPGYRTDTGAL